MLSYFHHTRFVISMNLSAQRNIEICVLLYDQYNYMYNYYGLDNVTVIIHTCTRLKSGSKVQRPWVIFVQLLCNFLQRTMAWHRFSGRNALLLTLGAHTQRGLQYLVCKSVRLSVVLSVTTFLRATRRPKSDTNGFSATLA